MVSPVKRAVAPGHRDVEWAEPGIARTLRRSRWSRRHSGFECGDPNSACQAGRSDQSGRCVIASPTPAVIPVAKAPANPLVAIRVKRSFTRCLLGCSALTTCAATFCTSS
jgi:hypothetical protein